MSDEHYDPFVAASTPLPWWARAFICLSAAWLLFLAVYGAVKLIGAL